MKTKFIGLEGFNEIESLSAKKRRANKKLTTAQKTVRFVKRAAAFIGKSVKEKVEKSYAIIFQESAVARTSGKKTASVKSVRANKSGASLIDKCYNANRTGACDEFSGSAREAISAVSFKSGRKYAHSAPVTGRRAHTLLKKKAILAVVACFSAVALSCVTVASALDARENTDAETVVSETEQGSVQPSSESSYSDGSIFYNATADEALEALNNDAYTSITKALVNDNIMTDCVGLYIDGELIGATSETDILKSALDKVLVDYRADYDDETTTEFANDVEIKNGRFEDNQIMSADQIMAAAEGKFSISLSTDIVYTREVQYSTQTEYDDSKSSSYEEVKTEGKNGKEEVTVRTTYIDGVQTNAVQTDSKTLEDAVDEVVVKGSKENKTSSDSSSSGSSGTFMWPMPYTHNITSLFEWRWGRMHQGIDISASGIYGQPIVAADGGTVIHSGDDGGGYGNYVVIDHGNGYQTIYAHCSSLAVSSGEYVSQGQTVGYVGSTGNSTGPHLHFEIKYDGTALDPLGFVS